MFVWLILLGNIGLETEAQVPPPPITSSGLNTQVSAPVNLPGGAVQHNITGGTRPGGGGNLFHSFGEFGVPTNNIANFLNDSALPTSNILSRVTGGNPSNIFGTIQTQGFGNANLFLMNPAGIVFGPNASLNVGGATHFTTADYLRLSDGVQFTALPGAQDALLSIAPVAAFGFLESNPASILVDGSTLSVEEGQTLSLVGGDITIGSSLNAPGGTIALASVASPGEVLTDTYDTAPNLNGQSFTAMGNMTLSEGTTLDVSADAAGTVIIRGGQLMMTNAVISADTIDSNGSPMAIDIDMTGDISISTFDGPALTARTSGTGSAGEIRVSSGGNMNFSGTGSPFSFYSMIDTVTSGPGNSGNVTLASQGDINVTGVDPADFVQVFLATTGTSGFDTGRGGDLSITAGGDFMGKFAFIDAGSFFAFIKDFIGGDGDAGNIAISTGGRIGLSSVGIFTESIDQLFGDTGGRSGNVALNAAWGIDLDNSQISATGFFQAGNVSINTDILSLSNRSQIGTLTRIEPGGMITIVARVVELSNSQMVSTTRENAPGGDISITATERISLMNPNMQSDISSIASNSFDISGFEFSGPSGNISISSPLVEIMDGSKINTITGSSGSGGQISITDATEIRISGQTNLLDVSDTINFGQFQASGIFTGSIGGNCAGLCGDAGSVNITTESLVMEKGGQINSSTTTDGKGGSINVNSSGNLSISGTLEDGTPGGVFSQTIGTDPGSGAGGTISLASGQNFTLSDGANISASSEGPGNAGAIAITAGAFTIAQGGRVDSGTTNTGAGGVITVNTSGNLSISGTLENAPSGVFSQSTGTAPGAGAGGAIALTAGQNFTLSDGATVSASSEGPANAGNIHITGNDTILIDNATVTTEAAQASGGNIELTANNTIQLVDSTIASSVQGDATTAGGNIKLDPDFIILKNSQILAKAVAGQGGNIELIANDAVLVDSQSTLDASSQTGISGSVTIESPIQVLSGTIAPLPSQPVNVATLYSARCVAGEGGHFSTFVDSKTDSVAPAPGTFLASPFLPLTEVSEKETTPSQAQASEMTQVGPEASIHLAAYTPPVLFASTYNGETSSLCR